MYIFFINFQIKISFLSIFLTQSRFFLDFRLFEQVYLKGELGIFSLKKVLLSLFQFSAKFLFDRFISLFNSFIPLLALQMLYFRLRFYSAFVKKTYT